MLTHRRRDDRDLTLTRRAKIRRSLAMAASRRKRFVRPPRGWRTPEGQAAERLFTEELSRAYNVRWGFAVPYEPRRES